MNHVPKNDELLGTLPNGAEIIAVFFIARSGVVLAQWKSEYVTWIFPKDISDYIPSADRITGTTAGNYFMYREGMENERLQKFHQAYRDFQARVSYALDNPLYI
jgi:hypothetical protein|tara:strand:+ start:572 stop:883 length:312 start_codon:yes stop_codon:yes gene_type:complete